MKSTRKHPGGTSGQPAFIHPLEIDGDQVQVSFRLAASEKNRFEAAQATLRAHELDMSLADVLRAAIREVTLYVEQRYGHPASATEDDVQHAVDSAGIKVSVRHSSTQAVEEWEANGDVDDKSTAPVASPLTGSSLPKENSGVGLAAGGGQDGSR